VEVSDGDGFRFISVSQTVSYKGQSSFSADHRSSSSFSILISLSFASRLQFPLLPLLSIDLLWQNLEHCLIPSPSFAGSLLSFTMCPGLTHLRHNPNSLLLAYLAVETLNHLFLRTVFNSLGSAPFSWRLTLHIPSWFHVVSGIWSVVFLFPLCSIVFNLTSLLIIHIAHVFKSSSSMSAKTHASCISLFPPSVRLSVSVM